MPELMRCDASDIAQVFVQAAQPDSRLLLAQPLPVDRPSIAWVTTDTQWRLTLWREPAGLDHTIDARSPDGRCWEYGCQREWLTDGAVIEPLEMLSSEQRVALDQRLLRANCWPETADCPMPIYVMEGFDGSTISG